MNRTDLRSVPQIFECSFLFYPLFWTWWNISFKICSNVQYNAASWPLVTDCFLADALFLYSQVFTFSQRSTSLFPLQNHPLRLLEVSSSYPSFHLSPPLNHATQLPYCSYAEGDFGHLWDIKRWKLELNCFVLSIRCVLHVGIICMFAVNACHLGKPFCS